MAGSLPNTIEQSQFLAVLGDFWGEIYGGSETVINLHAAAGLLGSQAMIAANESLAAFSFSNDSTLLHTELSFAIVLKQSQKNSVETSLLRYAYPYAAYSPSAGETFQYDVPIAASTWAFPIDGSVRSIPYITGNPLSQNNGMVEGVDYKIDVERSAIVFTNDPFEVYESFPIFDKVGNETDRYIQLWGRNAQIEKHHQFEHHGFRFGLGKDSTETKRGIIEALCRAGVEGPTRMNVCRLLSAVCNSGITLSRETVEQVSTAGGRQLIYTDSRAYSVSENAFVLYGPLDEVPEAKSLSDAIKFFEVDFKNFPLPFLVLPPGFFGCRLSGGLGFANYEVETTYSVDDDGLFHLRFPILGDPNDVELLWSTVEAAGVAGGTTLADVLSSRPDQVATYGSLPATINPLRFVTDNFLYANLLVVLINVEYIDLSVESLASLYRVAEMRLPYKKILLVVVMPDGSDQVDLVDSMDAPFYYETEDETMIVTEDGEETAAYTWLELGGGDHNLSC